MDARTFTTTDYLWMMMGTSFVNYSTGEIEREVRAVGYTTAGAGLRERSFVCMVPTFFRSTSAASSNVAEMWCEADALDVLSDTNNEESYDYCYLRHQQYLKIRHPPLGLRGKPGQAVVRVVVGRVVDSAVLEEKLADLRLEVRVWDAIPLRTTL
eukprot:scaffold17582_cov72-Cyclotella_meneghiniana.AAC.1